MSVDLIVVGVDDSPGSCAAVKWVVDVAAALSAKVVAVHTFEPLDHLDEVQPGTDFADVRATIERRIRVDWCGALAASGVDLEVVIKEGRAADVLISVAREREADLIVVGARRMGWLQTLTLGSTSQRVIAEARRPVTIIHPPDD